MGQGTNRLGGRTPHNESRVGKGKCRVPELVLTFIPICIVSCSSRDRSSFIN